ncbi:MAG: hypothetical protein DHS20C10_10850 [marine bacterium B5-7]|nr:MAG: hypothetical protein DHS20C10_10850 [marine bacterium B5-7]
MATYSKIAICLCLSIAYVFGFATQALYPFQQTHDAQRFQQLTHALRCMVCQNQTLAESQAPLAIDLRQQIYQRILHGEKNNTIQQDLVTHYGDFILYQPPFQPNTWVLWSAPAILLLLGLLLGWRITRRGKQHD